MTVTLLLLLGLRSDAPASVSGDDEDASAADMSKMGDAGGVLKVIRAAVGAITGSAVLLLLLLLLVVGVLGECGDNVINGGTSATATPLRFSVSLSPP